MTLLEVELAGSTTRTRTELADDVPIERLMTSMVTLVGDGSPADGRWYVYLPAGERLASHLTLARAGVGPGDTIYVTRATAAIDPGLPAPVPASLDDNRPSERTNQILPTRMTTLRRLLDTVRALSGTRSTIDAIEGPVWERTRSMWQWGDHRRRLEWMIGRAQLERRITIGVTCQADAGSSARLATAIAHALASARSDRIMLIDGDPHRAGVTRLAAGRSQNITSIADGSRVLDARSGSHPVTVLGCDLSGTDVPDFDVYRRALDRIPANAGVVVIDCGPVIGSRLADLCEQVVLVTDGPVDHHVRRMLQSRPTLVAVAPRPRLGMKAVDETLPTAMGAVEIADDLAGHEIATLLADGWARLGATT